MMAVAHRWIAALACLGFSLGPITPLHAASSTSSAISDSIGTSVGSISDSLEASSRSSSRKDDEVAQGDYRVTTLAAVPERPGFTRLTLVPIAPRAGHAAEFRLLLKQAAVEAEGLAPGSVITARPRSYGVEFARGTPARAFFLALNDDWYRDLQTRRVSL